MLADLLDLTPQHMKGGDHAVLFRRAEVSAHAQWAAAGLGRRRLDAHVGVERRQPRSRRQLLPDGEYLDSARRIYDAHIGFYQGIHEDNFYCLGLALRWLDPAVPFTSLVREKSAEVIDDLVSKKITFRSAHGDYGLLNYRDQGPYARYQRDYINASIYAPQEKPHHGHADENSLVILMADQTVLLADGGYLARFEDGWRADVFHNRVVARTGFPPESDIFDYLKTDTTNHPVTTEKIHFGNFGSLDYARTRLVDRERGYTGDRITLFAPETGLYIVVDSILIDEAGHKVFCNIWHPDKILRQGADYVVSWPDRIPIRQEYWPNPHHKDLLIQFLGQPGQNHPDEGNWTPI